MIRRTCAAAVAATLLAGGCSTFTDNDAVARVGDVSLSQDGLADIAPQAEGATTGTPTTEGAGDVEGDPVRATISNWIVTEVLADDVTARGGEVTEEDRGAARAVLEQSPGFTDESAPRQALFVDQRAVFDVWSQLPIADAEMEPFRENYERGTQVSGIVCTAHILVEREGEADEVVDELGGDVDRFAAVAGQRSIDEGSAASGGVLPCTDLSTFSQQYDPQFVAAATDADVGEIVGPVQTQFGYHVIVVRPFDAVRGDIAIYYAADRFAAIAEGLDVYVDPRYGQFDAADITVVPLGGQQPGGVPIPPSASS